jgi:hypothetical protein
MSLDLCNNVAQSLSAPDLFLLVFLLCFLPLSFSPPTSVGFFLPPTKRLLPKAFFICYRSPHLSPDTALISTLGAIEISYKRRRPEAVITAPTAPQSKRGRAGWEAEPAGWLLGKTDRGYGWGRAGTGPSHGHNAVQAYERGCGPWTGRGWGGRWSGEAGKGRQRRW